MTNWNAVAAIGTRAGTLVAAGAILAGIRGVVRQMWLATFCDFTKRYAEIADRLPKWLRTPDTHSPIAELRPETAEAIHSALRQYFNLCSEEHYLASEKVVDRRTWQIWVTWIKDVLRSSAMAEGWWQLRYEFEAYSDFCDFMDELVRTQHPSLPSTSTPALSDHAAS